MRFLGRDEAWNSLEVQHSTDVANKRESIIGRTARETIRNPITDELIVEENQLINDASAKKIESLGIDAEGCFQMTNGHVGRAQIGPNELEHRCEVVLGVGVRGVQSSLSHNSSMCERVAGEAHRG